MIEIHTLKDSDKGRAVTYRGFDKIEHGRITSWNDKYVFVRYHEIVYLRDMLHRPRYGETSEATSPEDLTWG